MPSLKSLKNSIASVKSTQKITSAMKMVSASKLKKAEEQVSKAEPYAIAMNGMVKEILKKMPNLANAPSLMKETGKSDKALYIIVSSDRGLCGGFIGNLVRKFKKEFLGKSDAKDFEIITVGKKAYDLLSREYRSKIISHHHLVGSNKKVNYDSAKMIITDVIAKFETGGFDQCFVVYNQFESVISQTPTMSQLIPIHVEVEKEAFHHVAKACAEFEPSQEELLDKLLPKSLEIKLYHKLLESNAGEHGARMSAMDNATRNAGDMIHRLTLQYNRSRQASITRELIEIISGAEAV